jgi:ferredoxin
MRIAVDLKTCENHGQCTFVAPDVFSLDDDGLLSFRADAHDEYRSSPIPQDLRDNVEDAIGMCPVQAIRELEGEH